MHSTTHAVFHESSIPKPESSSAHTFDLNEEKPPNPAADTNSPCYPIRTPSYTSKGDELPQCSQYTLQKRPWRRRVTEYAHIVGARRRGSGTIDDPFIVQWLDNDPENPKNYSNQFKWWMTFLLAFMTLCVSLASSAYTGAAGLIISEFDCSREVFLLGLSLMVAGFALGPLVWAPLSEAIGRRNVLLVALGLYIIFTAVCAAAQSIAALLILRLFCGTFGSAAFVIPGGMISDLFEAEQRGVAQAVFAAAPFLGPTLGPMIGGFSKSCGWMALALWLSCFVCRYLDVHRCHLCTGDVCPSVIAEKSKAVVQRHGKAVFDKNRLRAAADAEASGEKVILSTMGSLVPGTHCADYLGAFSVFINVG